MPSINLTFKEESAGLFLIDIATYYFLTFDQTCF